MRIVEELERLNGLGSPDAIAKELERSGIRGVSKSPFSCPLSVHLREFSDDHDLTPMVTVLKVMLMHEGVHRWGSFDLPAHVAEFVILFDKGKYPLLNGWKRTR